MDFRALRYFVCVAEEMHVSRAADRLGIAQPALSQQIKALETRLGVRLFLRRKRGIELTEAGAAFLAETRRTLAQHERAEHIARRMGRAEIGSLEIGYSGSVVFEPTLIELLRRYRDTVPDVRISLHDGSVQNHVQALLEQALEIAIIRGPLPDLHADLDASVFARQPLVLALPARHPAAQSPEIDLRDLVGEPLITVQDPAGYGLAHTVRELGVGLGLSLRLNLQVSDVFSILSMVSAGMGLSLVPAALRTLSWPGVTFHDLHLAADAPPASTEVLLVRRRDLSSLVGKRFMTAARRAAAHPARDP